MSCSPFLHPWYHGLIGLIFQNSLAFLQILPLLARAACPHPQRTAGSHPKGIHKKVDAVMMTMEHQSGNASKVCVPCTKGWFGKYNFGQMVAALEEPKIFVKA